MESPDLSPPSHVDASRPSLGFPLGTALLLLVIFSLSGIFSCCYHWEKLRSLRRRNLSDSAAAAGDSPIPPPLPKTVRASLNVKQSPSLPVLMPGDHIPKFMALPCPCEPPRPELNVLVHVQNPPKPPPLPRFPVPLY